MRPFQIVFKCEQARGCASAEVVDPPLRQLHDRNSVEMAAPYSALFARHDEAGGFEHSHVLQHGVTAERNEASTAVAEPSRTSVIRPARVSVTADTPPR